MSGILAEYDRVGAAVAGVTRLREAGHEDVDVFSPIPSAELEEALGIVSSPMRRWALIGGISGFLTAVALTGLTSLAYPLVTQGKPILAWPAYFVIMFELTILLTGLFGFGGLLYHTKRRRKTLSPAYREGFSVDRFGVFVPNVGEGGDGEGGAGIESILRDTGAVSIDREVGA